MKIFLNVLLLIVTTAVGIYEQHVGHLIAGGGLLFCAGGTLEALLTLTGANRGKYPELSH